MAGMAWRGFRRGRRKQNPKAVGLRMGFRSGLEEANAGLLKEHGHKVQYEALRIPYTVPAKVRHYTPDFRLQNGILVETKGLWEQQDRAKIALIMTQYPGLDLRLVFSNPNSKIYKGSKTTYADFAEGIGCKWAKKLIPVSWLAEPGQDVDAILASPLYDLSTGPAR